MGKREVWEERHLVMMGAWLNPASPRDHILVRMQHIQRAPSSANHHTCWLAEAGTEATSSSPCPSSLACIIAQTAQLQMGQPYSALATAQMLTLKTQAPQGECRSPGQLRAARHPQQSPRRSGMRLGTPVQQPIRSRSRKRSGMILSPRRPLSRVKGKTLHIPLSSFSWKVPRPLPPLPPPMLPFT